MHTEYKLQGSTVLRNGRAHLGLGEVAEFMSFAVRRKLRRRGHVTDFLTRLERGGQAEYTWNFCRSYHASAEHGVTVEVHFTDEGYRLTCTGPSALHTVKRVTHTLDRRRARRISTVISHVWEKKRAKKARRTRRSVPLARSGVPKQRKQKIKTAAAPLSLKTKKKLTPQFRNQHFFWDEAADSVVAIFAVKGTYKRSARQRVCAELYESLERTHFTFAQFKRGGFVLRFDVIGGAWRGDITPLSVSATKDNTHPTYRKMREHLKDKFLFLDISKRQKRRLRKEAALELPPNVILFRGAQYKVA